MRGSSLEEIAERRNKRVLGFKHLVHESFVNRSNLSRPHDNKWSGVMAPPIIGAIMDGNDTNKIGWVVEENHHRVGEDQFLHCNIRTIACSRAEVQDGSGLCRACFDSKQSLSRRFEAAVDIREGLHNPNTRNSIVERTTSLHQERTDYHRRESRNKSKKIARREKIIADLLDKTAINVPMNDHLDEVFNDDVAEAAKKFLSKEVSQESVSEYAFAQTVKNHKIAREKGDKAVRHCPLMIRLGCLVRETMGYKGGLYSLVAKICGLPSDRQIRRYNIANSNDPDGFMRANVLIAQNRFDQANPGLGRFDWKRHMSVALDSMHTKGGFEVNYHINQLVGVADNAFDKDVLKDELKMLEKNDEEDSEIVIPEIAKHFLVFIATTWASEQKHQFLVAQYALKTINSSFLVREIRSNAILLILYGWVMDTIVGDGASKKPKGMENSLHCFCKRHSRRPMDSRAIGWPSIGFHDRI
mmetsp:Transcript_19434/g.41004  ORF Transcript_19434/g.41004 Transcript_19434/m.41004 type:complete len:471 (+) Transcript_19434:601-2013(+)